MSNHDDGTNDRFHLYSVALIDRLKMMSSKEGEEAARFADDVCRTVLGTALDPETYFKLEEEEQFEFVGVLEKVLNSADLVTMVFLIEKMNSAFDRELWDAIKAIDELSGIVLDACLDPENRAGFERENSRKFLLRANDLLEYIDDMEKGVLPIDVLMAMLKHY